MKKTLAIMLALIMVLALVPTVAFAAGNTIYVDAKNGNDANVGSKDKPYKTVGKAAEKAVSGDTITLGEGEYTLYNIPSDNTTKGKNLTFIGQGFDKTTWNIGTGTVDVFGQGNGDFSFNGSGTIEFQNMTLKAAVINGTGEQVDRDYTGFAHTTNTIVKNCTVNGKTFYWGYTSATFTNTTFNCPAGDYAVWTYSSPTMTFDECTFNSTGKVINVYTDYGAGKQDITVNFKNCTVNNTGESLKPVLNINDSNMVDFKYILNITGDNKVSGVDVDDITCSRLFGFGGKAATNNAGKTVVQIDGKTVWKNGSMVSHAIDTKHDKYTDGYKDNKFEIIKDTTTGVYVKKCIYCGYTEPFYGELSNEIGLKRTVRQGQEVKIETPNPKDTYKVNGPSGITVDYTATMDMTKLEWEKQGSLYDDEITPWQMLAMQPGWITEDTVVFLKFTFDKNINLEAFKAEYNAPTATPADKEKLLKLESNMFKIADEGGVQFDIEKREMTIKCNWNWNKETGHAPDPTITLYGCGLPVKNNWNGNKQIDITNSGCVRGTVHIKYINPRPYAKMIAETVPNVAVNQESIPTPSLDTIQIPIVGGCKTDEFTLYYGGGSSGDSGHSYYYPTTTPVPVIVIPPKTGDMTVWQSILHFLGVR